MRYLQFCSDVYIYGKKENERDKEYSLLKHDRFCLLFICLCFSLKPNSVLQSILLIVLFHWEKELFPIWGNSKQRSNWKEALKGVPKKLNITNMKFGIWKTWHKLEWINKRVNVFKRCYFWYFVSGHQFLRLLIEIILWVTFLVRSVMLNVFIQSMKSELN